MPDGLPLAQRLSIREAGYDEYWLQNQIYGNPACLGLGDLTALAKERLQSSGGRLDIMLKNPDDDTMYEVEVMLGETDETHIIRTIEYWDNEKRRWPKRRHIAVLVAEHINGRFFNVIHILSHFIPIVAIQVSLLQSNGTNSLYFSIILDTFEEIEDSEPSDNRTDREYWKSNANWTLETAEALLAIVQGVFPDATLNYAKGYVAIKVAGNNYFGLNMRKTNNKSMLDFRMSHLLQDETAAFLDGRSISYIRQPKQFRISVDKEMIEKNRETFLGIANLVKRTWQSES